MSSDENVVHPVVLVQPTKNASVLNIFNKNIHIMHIGACMLKLQQKTNGRFLRHSVYMYIYKYVCTGCMYVFVFYIIIQQYRN